MKLVYSGPLQALALNIGEHVVYYRGQPFEAIGQYAEHLIHKLHPHRFDVVAEESEPVEVKTPAKRVGRKPKE